NFDRVEADRQRGDLIVSGFVAQRRAFRACRLITGQDLGSRNDCAALIRYSPFDGSGRLPPRHRCAQQHKQQGSRQHVDSLLYSCFWVGLNGPILVGTTSLVKETAARRVAVPVGKLTL